MRPRRSGSRLRRWHHEPLVLGFALARALEARGVHLRLGQLRSTGEEGRCVSRDRVSVSSKGGPECKPVVSLRLPKLRAS